jgi:hypothetical protein
MTMAVQTYQAFNIDLTSLIYESAIKLFLCLPFDIVELQGASVMQKNPLPHPAAPCFANSPSDTITWFLRRFADSCR